MWLVLLSIQAAPLGVSSLLTAALPQQRPLLLAGLPLLVVRACPLCAMAVPLA